MSSKFTVEDIQRQIEGLSRQKVIVFGAAGVGRTLRFQAGKLPSNANVMLGDAAEEHLFVSGSLAMANSLAGLCGQVEVVALVGDRSEHEDVLRGVCDPRTDVRLVKVTGHDNDEEIHFVSRQSGGELLSLHCLGSQTEDCRKEILSEFSGRPEEFDLVIFSDPNFCGLSGGVLACPRNFAKASAVKVCFDQDGWEQKGRQEGSKVDFAWVNDAERGLTGNQQYRDVSSLKNWLLEKVNCRVLMLPNHAEGSVWYLSEDEIIEVPDLSSSQIGRAVRDKLRFSFSAAFLALGMNLELSGFVASAAGAICSQSAGRCSVGYVDLIKYLTRLLKI
jgi:bifunctional ADP-heptose synthase (sugar kinase/adenylyltransferase)